MNPASKAASIAERARTRQNARSDVPATPTPTDPKESQAGNPALPAWYVRKADGDLVHVIFHPPLSAADVRARFYPDALSILPSA